MDIQDRLDKEIEQIENDPYLDDQEKMKEIRELERDYRSAAEEAAQQAYDDELDSWTIG